MGELDWVWTIFIRVARALIWTAGTVWLGAVTFVRLARYLFHLRRALAETQRCPRGHVTPTYGVFECSCGALHEGWAFSPCRICGQSAGWIPCTVCGLPIRNPLP